MADKEKDLQHEDEGSTSLDERVRTKKPVPYKVLLLNDDYTTMDFVVSVLETIFKKSPAESVRIMLEVHHKGFGVCGVFPKQIAETKVSMVHNRAQAEGYPLRCSIEEA